MVNSIHAYRHNAEVDRKDLVTVRAALERQWTEMNAAIGHERARGDAAIDAVALSHENTNREFDRAERELARADAAEKRIATLEAAPAELSDGKGGFKKPGDNLDSHTGDKK